MDALFDTADMIGTLHTIHVPNTFFLSTFFDMDPFLSDKEHIVFDEVLEDLPTMAPFVSPLVAAKPQKSSGFSTKIFKPAYVKPLHAVKPGDGMRRMAGEAMGGTMSAEQRVLNKAIDLLRIQKSQIIARCEWMAANAVVNGKVIIKGEDYPEVEIDFGRKAELTKDVSGDATGKWSTVGNDIGSQLEDWSEELLTESGFAGTDVIMDKKAWRALKKNTGFQNDLDRRRGVDNVPVVTPRKPMQGVEYKGKWGAFELWLYTGTQRDQSGAKVSVLAAGEISMVARPGQPRGGIAGIKAFGAIQDLDSMEAVEMFPKSWTEKNPSVRQLMTQSAPLMIPGRPNASMKAKVVA